MGKVNFYILIFIQILIPIFGKCQNLDSLDSAPRKKWHQSKLLRTTVVPALLIGYGVSTIRGNGLYSSYDAQRDIQRGFSGFKTEIDDYLVYVPYAELLALNLFKIKCKSDFLNTGLLILKSELLMVAMVYPLKKITHIERPNGKDFKSFPSGHTSEAFVAASIIHKEFKHISPWPGIGAYAVATSVGIFRMLNNAHWQSDVFAGAGFGMLAVHLAYLTHKNKFRWSWTKKGCLLPIYREGAMGVRYSLTF